MSDTESPQHEAVLTTVRVATLPGPGTAEDAFEVRRRRLRDAKTPHTADRAALTLEWVDPHDGSHVTLAYREAGRG